MKSADVEIGHVLRYDFLWKDEEKQGRDHGKDRPCAVVIIIRDEAAGGRRIMVCPITHTPPDDEYAVELPNDVRAYLGLDEAPCWVRTNQFNEFFWPEAAIPYGLTRTPDGSFCYGKLPYALRETIRAQNIRAIEESKSQRSKRD